MKRSIFTNQFIKSMLDNNNNHLVVYDSEEKIGVAHGFKEACALIDQVINDTGDYITVKVIRNMDSFKYGWFFLVMQNDGDEQVSDFSVGNDFIDRRWNNLNARFDQKQVS